MSLPNAPIDHPRSHPWSTNATVAEPPPFPTYGNPHFATYEQYMAGQDSLTIRPRYGDSPISPEMGLAVSPSSVYSTSASTMQEPGQISRTPESEPTSRSNIRGSIKSPVQFSRGIRDISSLFHGQRMIKGFIGLGDFFTLRPRDREEVKHQQAIDYPAVPNQRARSRYVRKVKSAFFINREGRSKQSSKEEIKRSTIPVTDQPSTEQRALQSYSERGV